VDLPSSLAGTQQIAGTLGRGRQARFHGVIFFETQAPVRPDYGRELPGRVMTQSATRRDAVPALTTLICATLKFSVGLPNRNGTCFCSLAAVSQNSGGRGAGDGKARAHSLGSEVPGRRAAPGP
jgi:hypothetical protein